MTSAARGLSLFLGGFTILNLAGDLRLGTNANLWWIDFAPLPLIVTRMLLIAVSIALITHAISTRRRLIDCADRDRVCCGGGERASLLRAARAR